MKILCWLGFHSKGQAVAQSPTPEQVQHGIEIGCTRILSRHTYLCGRCGTALGKPGVIYLRGDVMIDAETGE